MKNRRNKSVVPVKTLSREGYLIGWAFDNSSDGVKLLVTEILEKEMGKLKRENDGSEDDTE